MVTQIRYDRQTILPEIGARGQAALDSASVLVVGAGGLGAPALLYLAGAGVGRIGVVDFDVVEETNLHRQVIYTMDQIGQNKATAAANKLHALNPEIIVEVYTDKLTGENAPDLFSAYDLVIDGTDNFETKFLINDAGVKYGVPVVYGAVLGFDGQVAVFDHVDKDAPCYRCLYPHPPKNHIPNCAEAGVVGALAGMIGSMQAMEAIKYIVGDQRLPATCGAMVCVDARSMTTRRIEIPKDINCGVCSKSKADIVLEMNDAKEACDMIKQITVDETRNVMGQDNVLLIDVREQDEWDAGHIDGAEFFSLSRLMAGDRGDWDKMAQVILYCRSGKRSMSAAQILQSQGYQDLSNMVGGILAWI